jgi:tetratricopeptide (TPR) repeat protein
LTHPHPLLRASAAALLADDVSQQNFSVLVTAAKDDYRVVRIAAATALARYPQGLLDLPSARAACEAAFRELEASHRCMPDSWASHYNLGNYFEARGLTEQALASYAQATRLRPDMVPPLVNASMMQARRGDLHASIALLRRAEAADPRNPAVHLNLGMALAEQHDMPGAERHFRAALAADPSLAQAAYNLGVLLNRAAPTDEGVALCRRAAELAPQHAGYVYTYAYYLMMRGHADEVARVLRDALQRGVTSPEITSLLDRLTRGQP